MIALRLGLPNAGGRDVTGHLWGYLQLGMTGTTQPENML